MPEGDSVYRAAAALHRGLAGQELTRSDLRVPRLATADLTGRTVLECVPRGKHLLLRLGPAPGAAPSSASGPLTLHSHLMMEGRWEVTETASSSGPGAAAGRGAGGGRRARPAHTLRAVLETATARATAHSVQQLVLVPTPQEDRLVGHLGPDLLDPQWSPAHREEAVRRLLLRPERPIAAALLDQSLLAGIGNIYRCELLFLHRLAPQTPVGQVPELGAIVEDAHRLLELNRDRPRRITTGDPRRGGELGVYGRERRPCLRCGTPIAKRTWDDAAGERDPRTRLPAPSRERPFYFCPRCQAG